VQEWHGTRDTVIRDKVRAMLYKELRKNGHPGRGIERNQNAIKA
jgi:hypothetical protein